MVSPPSAQAPVQFVRKSVVCGPTIQRFFCFTFDGARAPARRPEVPPKIISEYRNMTKKKNLRREPQKVAKWTLGAPGSGWLKIIFNIEYDKNKESLTGAQNYPFIIRGREAPPNFVWVLYTQNTGGCLKIPKSWLPGIILISEYDKNKKSLTSGWEMC